MSEYDEYLLWKLSASQQMDNLRADIRRLKAEKERLFELAQILVHCMGEVDNCDTCRINDNPCEVSVDEWFACDSLHDLLREQGVIE